VESAAKNNEAFRPLVYTEVDGHRQPTWNLTLMQGALASFAYDRTGIGALADWLGPNESNPGLAYVDTTANGFGRATFSRDDLQVTLVAMEDLTRPFKQAPSVRFTAQFRVARWQNDSAPEIVGPSFDGDAPFPFSRGDV
jgi:hypothetical protein